MKTKFILAALVLGLAAVSCNQPVAETAPDGAAAPVSEKDYTPSKAEIDSVSYLVGVNFGGFLKSYDFGDLNYSEVVKGMKDMVKAEGADPRDPEFEKQFKYSPNSINNAFNAYLEKRHKLVSLKAQREEKSFLAKNAKKSGVQVSESGLQYTILEAGNDVKPAAHDTVTVYYKGTFTDGKVFDETAEGADPIEFALDRVIGGWTEGLQLIGEGGKIRLFVPSHLGYGESGNQVIPPFSVLVFDVELLKVAREVLPE